MGACLYVPAYCRGSWYKRIVFQNSILRMFKYRAEKERKSRKLGIWIKGEKRTVVHYPASPGRGRGSGSDTAGWETGKTGPKTATEEGNLFIQKEVAASSEKLAGTAPHSCNWQH